MFATRERSISPLRRTIRPSRATIACLTSSSSRSRRWTIASLEIVAAPWRANAFSVSLFPAPIPPVIATETGRTRLLPLGVLGGGLELGLGLGTGVRLGLRSGLGLVGDGVRL